MAVILGKLVQLYNFLNDEISDPRTQEWFLMSNPFPGIAIISLYLYIVLDFGPKYMAERKPFSLKNTILIYNIVQIIVCAYILYQSLILAWFNDYKFICQPVDTSDNPVSLAIASKVCYSYFIVKIVDLLDTIFFVLRKKQKQVSFLHVYHHAGMIVLSWSMVKWLPGGHGILLVTINSFVHSFMYTYYLLTAYDESYKNSIWWKKHVTQIQLIQFGILLLHFLAVFFIDDCQYPLYPSMFMSPQCFFIFALFSDFYIKTYIRKPKN